MLTVPSNYISPATVQLFRDGGQLPVGYGVASSERAVEFAWALASLPAGGGKLLDAGSTLNHKELLDLPWVNDWHIHILSAGPEQECHFQKGISYLYEDLRDIPIRDGYYDVVACISVLDHLGLDNSVYYGGAKEHDLNAYQDALDEMNRVLKIGGSLIITVPFGKPQDLGWMRQFSKEMIDSFHGNYSYRQVETFAATSEGWKRVSPEICRDVEYQTNRGRAGAVACVILAKE